MCNARGGRQRTSNPDMVRPKSMSMSSTSGLKIPQCCNALEKGCASCCSQDLASSVRSHGVALALAHYAGTLLSVQFVSGDGVG